MFLNLLTICLFMSLDIEKAHFSEGKYLDPLGCVFVYFSSWMQCQKLLLYDLYIFSDLFVFPTSVDEIKFDLVRVMIVFFYLV